MQEIDLIWMSLLIFIPTIFALGLLLFPKGWEEAMRWWSLFGTALTLGVSLCVFILWYTQVHDSHPSNPEAASLNARADAQDLKLGESKKGQDWLARVPWVSRFNLDSFVR